MTTGYDTCYHDHMLGHNMLSCPNGMTYMLIWHMTHEIWHMLPLLPWAHGMVSTVVYPPVHTTQLSCSV